MLWVIRPTVRPADEHRLARDILRDMFQTKEDFKKHVVVIFTFDDKSRLENPVEWLTELCDPQVEVTGGGKARQGNPVPRSIKFGKYS